MEEAADAEDEEGNHFGTRGEDEAAVAGAPDGITTDRLPDKRSTWNNRQEAKTATRAI